jgi:CBS domain-containing protein
MSADELPSIRDALVGQVMSEAVETIPADSTVSDAATRLFDADIGSLLVDAETGSPDGILTESDFVALAARERDPGALAVADCMSSPVVTVRTAATLGEAAELMADENVKKLPVIDEPGGGVVGMVTTTDIAKYLPVHEFHPEG